MIKKRIKLTGKDKFKIGLLIISLLYWIPEGIIKALNETEEVFVAMRLGLIQGFVTGMMGFLVISVSYDIIEKIIRNPYKELTRPLVLFIGFLMVLFGIFSVASQYHYNMFFIETWIFGSAFISLGSIPFIVTIIKKLKK